MPGFRNRRAFFKKTVYSFQENLLAGNGRDRISDLVDVGQNDGRQNARV